MVYFLKRLETSPFRWGWITGARSKDSAMLSIIHETFSQMALCFRSTRLAASWKLRRNLNFCLIRVFRARAESKSALFSVFRVCATRPKVTSVSSGTNASATLGKNRNGSVCCCFSRLTESGTFERLSVFPERVTDFHDFPEQIR